MNDVPDFGDLPDSLHLSQGTVAPVTAVTAGTPSGTPSEASPTLELAVSMPPGWGYVRVPDPADGTMLLREVRRADGSILAVGTNVWVTDRTFGGFGKRPVRENVLHLLDFAGVGPYRLTYGLPPSADTVAPASQVIALPARSPVAIPVRWEGTDPGDPTGDGLTFDIRVSVDAGPFLPWINQTPDRGSIYPGESGRRYAFQSIATDRAGNREAAGAAADAETVAGLPNTAPRLTVSGPVAVDEGAVVSLVNRAVDDDVPADSLTWSLGDGAPVGARITPEGAFTWTPDNRQGPSTNLIRVTVTDDGIPARTAARDFMVIVRDTEGDFDLTVGSTTGVWVPEVSVPLSLSSGLDLGRISFVLEARTGRLGEPAIDPLVAELGSAQVVPDGTNRFRVTLTAVAGEVLQGNRPIAALRFRPVAGAGRRSVAEQLIPVGLSGVRSGGELVPLGKGIGGRVILVGDEPVIELGTGQAGAPIWTFHVHGVVGRTYKLL